MIAQLLHGYRDLCITNPWSVLVCLTTCGYGVIGEVACDIPTILSTHPFTVPPAHVPRRQWDCTWEAFCAIPSYRLRFKYVLIPQSVCPAVATGAAGRTTSLLHLRCAEVAIGAPYLAGVNTR
jgi:hypothetical protein